MASKRVIRSVASQLDGYLYDAYLRDKEFTLDDARARNLEGWTVEVPSGDRMAAARGSYIRHEGFSLDDADLRTAYTLAVGA